MKPGLKWLAAGAMLALPLSAQALLADCTVAGSGVAFGSYASPGSTTATGTGTVTVTCTGLGLLVSYTIQLSAGNGTFATRLLKSGVTNALNYNMYTDTARTIVWGDGSAGTSTVSDSYLLSIGSNARNYTAYGLIPASQSKPAGTYTDTLTITITY
ncbi:spore Coat Protein U domain protein [Collimonas arenae]|uniref:Spore Coat Protein U domain protein n=1 Tax=Collimonas arenae TaxID=279058 RepID=A0A127QI54_9BURK|nr:spore coat U domain-containing protein [Collimonas arenae]AMO99842.1 spore Coat Protein U domain protein [Collimonas arenae]AMP09741.1 spore Coat Protein U domain protein [Collimonas arenae]